MGAFRGLNLYQMPYNSNISDNREPSEEEKEASRTYFAELSNQPYSYPHGNKIRNASFIGPYKEDDCPYYGEVQLAISRMFEREVERKALEVQQNMVRNRLKHRRKETVNTLNEFFEQALLNPLDHKKFWPNKINQLLNNLHEILKEPV